ncbi:MAG: transcriptional regulator [Bacteroidota bacterium]|nr:transcriptional regulator [Bacteroidota bacterium]MDP4232561.1 transcriptional regulator [Bacteroidota bacterium]MDP4242984.1 transcriptional regulator [Bacteroidota bacterium]MDP4286441.1 transcriptional regulator [Bacteroidota bacterium]
MRDFDYQQLDDLIHSRIRLAVVSVLVSVDEAEFTFLREKVHATDGNLSIHLKKLEEANYISVTKQFVDKKPQTTYKLTRKGRKAFEEYVDRLEKMVRKT